MTATEFTPLAGLAGGILIGLAAVLMMLTTGRIAGVSGVVAKLIPPYGDAQAGNRMAFIAGLVVAPLALVAMGATVPIAVTSSMTLLAAGGLLVGAGTVWGSGCTSGHGVCGLARLLRRSMAATGIFMATALATVFVMRHVAGG